MFLMSDDYHNSFIKMLFSLKFEIFFIIANYFINIQTEDLE